MVKKKKKKAKISIKKEKIFVLEKKEQNRDLYSDNEPSLMEDEFEEEEDYESDY